jgi:hypothetical protein
MRFDMLDEYSTLVPFGLGVSKRNRVIQYPAAPTKAVKRGAIAKLRRPFEAVAQIRSGAPPYREARRISADTLIACRATLATHPIADGTHLIEIPRLQRSYRG